MNRGPARGFATILSTAFAVIATWCQSTTAMPGSDPSEACRTEEIGPGKEWTSPDGTKSVKNEGRVTLYVSVFKDEDGHCWYLCAIPLKGVARVKGFNAGDPNKKYDRDEIDVGKGSAVLDDCNETEISIDGGSAECTDCDQNQIGFGDDGGTLGGEGNDRNTVNGTKQPDADVTDFNGRGNTFS